MPDQVRMGPKAEVRVQCPVCGRMTFVNIDGTLRHHFPESTSWASGGRPCKGSRQPCAEGSVQVRKLRDGFVVRVRHVPGLFADDAVTDELVLAEPEWAELVRVTTVAERARLRPLVTSWRESADVLERTDPGRAREFRDRAAELERLLAAGEGEGDGLPGD